MVSAIVWKYRTGSPWRDLPERFGPWQTAWKRHATWSRDGTWDRVVAAVQAQVDAAGDLDWLVGVDSTIVRAHQHAAGARPVRGAGSNHKDPVFAEPVDHAWGRSRGRLTTKIHTAADGKGRPLAFVPTGGPCAPPPRPPARNPAPVVAAEPVTLVAGPPALPPADDPEPPGLLVPAGERPGPVHRFLDGIENLACNAFGDGCYELQEVGAGTTGVPATAGPGDPFIKVDASTPGKVRWRLFPRQTHVSADPRTL